VVEFQTNGAISVRRSSQFDKFRTSPGNARAGEKATGPPLDIRESNRRELTSPVVLLQQSKPAHVVGKHETNEAFRLSPDCASLGTIPRDTKQMAGG
jgi:hypothetical protein